MEKVLKLLKRVPGGSVLLLLDVWHVQEIMYCCLSHTVFILGFTPVSIHTTSHESRQKAVLLFVCLLFIFVFYFEGFIALHIHVKSWWNMHIDSEFLASYYNLTSECWAQTNIQEHTEFKQSFSFSASNHQTDVWPSADFFNYNIALRLYHFEKYCT